MSDSKKPNNVIGLQSDSPSESVSSKILDKPVRRTFSLRYKREILSKIEACKKSGRSVGDLVRSEGLYSSQISNWRKEIERIDSGKSPTRRGPKPSSSKSERARIAKLEAEISRLQNTLRQAKAVIDIQKKVCELLGIQQQNLPEIVTKS